MTRGAPAPRWVIATGNPGKLIELRALLEPAGLALAAQSDLGVESPPETGATFVENALIKARHAARQTGLAAIADDSGLVVDALDGEPGIHSARYAGPESRDSDNVEKLLAAMHDLPPTARGAHFYCVIVALRSADDPAPVIAQGRWRGQIAPEPVGAGGFGYDPVFFDPALGQTAAELTPEVKNGLSHRGRALAALAAGLAGTDTLG